MLSALWLLTDPDPEILPSATLRGPFCSPRFTARTLLPCWSSFSRQLFKVPSGGAGRHWVPHAPSTGSEFTACSALAGCLLPTVFLDAAQGMLATCLNNSVSSLNMQNMQHNLARWVFFLKEFGSSSSWLLELGRAGRGLPFPLPRNGRASGVMTWSLLRYAARWSLRALFHPAVCYDNVNAQAVIVWQRNRLPYEITQRDSSAC